MGSDVQVIIATLAYYDMFDYPLTGAEIEKFVGEKITKDTFASLKDTHIRKIDNYFVLSGRENIISIRQKREKISLEKLQKTKKIIGFLTHIPTLLYIGISGSLALKHAKETDDIDLFIITKPGTLWVSRLLVNTFLLFSGKLRRFKKAHTKDTICTNMWIDSVHMRFTPTRHNMYTAHEIVQLYTVYDRQHIHEQFLASNDWIQLFLPKVSIKTRKMKFDQKIWWILPLEFVAKRIQLLYMKNHRTTEVISEGFVAFHPNDYTKRILGKWSNQQKKWHIN